MVAELVTGLIIVLIVAFLITQAIRITREYQRLVVFRLGKCLGAKGPGPVLLIPFVDRPVLVDLRELFVEIPHQACITRDNVPIAIDFLVYRQVVDPLASVIAVNNFASAAQGVAATTLRSVIGDLSLDEVLANREQINHVLRQKLDEVTERWGVKVTTVEIREVVPPGNVQEAMNRQMSAERTRRAAVTEAEGRRQASITVAEGEKQARILQAEGEKQARVLRAQGEAQALETIFAAARGVDAKTMSLQVIEGLKVLGSGSGSTFVIPMEFTRLLGQFGDFLDQSLGGKATAPVAVAPASDGDATPALAAPVTANGPLPGSAAE